MDKLTSKHFIFIILGTGIVGFKTYPNIVIQFARRDSWIATILACILIFLLTIYIINICNKTNTYNIYTIYTEGLGKRGSTIALFFLALTLFLTLLESSSIEASAVHENLFSETPPWYILIFFILAAVYSISSGLNALIIISIVGITLIMFAGFNLGIMTSKFKQNKFLFPILENGFNLNFWIGVLKSLGFLGSIYIFLPFLVHLDNNKKEHLIQSCIIGLLIVIQMHIISITGVITTFGPERSLTLWYPKLIQTQLVGYFGFLESGEFFVLLQMVGGWFIKYILSFYAFLGVIKEFNLKNKYNTIIFSSLVYILSVLLCKNAFVFLRFLNYYNYFCIVNFVIIPFIAFSLFIIKHILKNKTSK